MKMRTGSNISKRKVVFLTSKAKVKEGQKEPIRKWYLLLALIGVITLSCYLNCLNNKFVFDDIPLILKNPDIKGIEKIPRLLGIGKSRVSYRPMRMISYAVDYTLNKKLWKQFRSYKGVDEGLNPFGYHLSNLAYHILTSFIVFLLVLRLLANYRIAFLAASLFALHPVHTDSVSYLAGRRDILFALFYLAGFYLFLCYRQTHKYPFILASFLAYFLSLASKEMAVTLPAIFLCYDLTENFNLLERNPGHLWKNVKSYSFSRDSKSNPNVSMESLGELRKINLTYFKKFFYTIKKVIMQSKYLYSLLFIGALSYSYYKVFIKSPSYQVSYYGDSILITFLTVGKILVYYLKLLVYPIKLNADYSYNAFPLSSAFFEPSTFLSFTLLGVTVYAVLRLLAQHKILAFGIIWFFVTLLPVCQIFPHHELLAEHYLYLPSFGFCLIGASLLNGFFNHKKYTYLGYTSFMVVVILFSIRIVERNKDWRDRLTLWKKTVSTVPHCARAHYNLGNVYIRKGRFDEALSEYQQALAIKPNYAEVHNNLGSTYVKKGMLDKAVSEYEQAIAINPRNAKAYNNLGSAYLKKGMLDKAVSKYKQALAIKSRNAKTISNLGVVYYLKGKLYEATIMQKHALTLKPNFAEAHYNLGNAYFGQGKLNEAISEYKQALTINRNFAGAHHSLAMAYFEEKQYHLAVKHCDRALELGFKISPSLLKNLLSYR